TGAVPYSLLRRIRIRLPPPLTLTMCRSVAFSKGSTLLTELSGACGEAPQVRTQPDAAAPSGRVSMVLLSAMAVVLCLEGERCLRDGAAPAVRRLPIAARAQRSAAAGRRRCA